MAVGTYFKAALSVSIFLAAVSGAAASPPTEAQPEFPADGAVIAGDEITYLGDDYIWTRLVFIPGATAVSHVGYFSEDYSKVDSRDPCAFLGSPPYGPSWEYTLFAGNPQVPPADDSLVRGTKYYWTVDERDAMGNTFAGDIWEFVVQGYYACAPNPPNEAVDVETIVLLSWIPGFDACRRDVYLGTSLDDVNNAVYDPINPPPEFLGATYEPNILVTGLESNTKYYWRVDELSGRSCCTPFNGCLVYKGDVWSFTTVVGEAQCDYPEDGAVIPGEIMTYLGEDYIFTELIFIPGATAVEHTGYFSKIRDEVANRAEVAKIPPPIVIPFPPYTYIVPVLGESLIRGQVYYWTVDATDALGNTFLGDVWEFTIQGFKAFEPSPPNEAILVDTIVLLSWLPGYDATEHDVYLGTSWDDVNNVVYDHLNPSPVFLDTVSEPNILITSLEFNTKYYWRVDEVHGRLPPFGIGIVYKGDVWCFTTEPRRIFVDVDATGADNGASWENAYKFLQDALIDANSALKPVEIWVAEGIYTPDSNSADPNGSGDRTATFQLINGVTIKGGYAGFGQPNPNARDIQLYETILSGDLDGNDGPDFANNGENSYNVVTGSGTDVTAVLDGFTITRGNANGSFPHSQGGGMYNCEYSDPTLINCIFSGNSAWKGGGMYNGEFGYSNDTGPKLTNCMFTGNSAEHVGGGMANSGAYPTLINCIFMGNSGGGSGGGMSNYQSNPMLTNCIFIDNSAPEVLIGGGGGGGMGNNRSSPILTNCTFSGNSALWGGGMCNSYESNPTITNCIFWDDTPNEIYIYSVSWPGGTPVITYSDVQGGWGGVGNIDADPCFVDAAGGDLRLSSDSPCIDTGDNNAPNLPATDFDGHQRIIDGDCNDTDVVDMGAFEFNYAYMGDFDYNCRVNFTDLSIFGSAWTSQPGDFNWDFACNISIPADNVINKLDLAAFADNWLAGIQ